MDSSTSYRLCSFHFFIKLACEFWQCNDLFVLVSWGKRWNRKFLFFFELVLQFRKHSSCGAISVFHEYIASNRSVMSAVIRARCVNILYTPSFLASLGQGHFGEGTRASKLTGSWSLNWVIIYPGKMKMKWWIYTVWISCDWIMGIWKDHRVPHI